MNNDLLYFAFISCIVVEIITEKFAIDIILIRKKTEE